MTLTKYLMVLLVEKEGYFLWKVHFSKDGYLMNHKGDLVEDHRGAEFSGYFTPQLIPRSTLSEHIDYLDFEMKIYEFILECYAEIVCGSDAINSQIDRDMLNVGAMKMKEDNEELDGRLGLRFITRNTYEKVRNSSSNKKDYENEVNKYFVSGHIRKLPENHNPSKEAAISALEYGVELPNGYTFVKPYESGDEKLRTRLVKTI
ncbi:hypothetical protein [Oceanobacillus kimchii]|uniref:hypothetical protein n=1 Tax=Oceanobacillus kimchii TaxID=746691 RepID=UPI003C73C174